MSFLIQHGYGKGSDSYDRIRMSLEARIASGVIFGPDTVAPNSLESYIQGIRNDYPDTEIFIDPQIYVATIENPNYKRLRDYQDRYFQVNLSRRSFNRPRFIQDLVQRTIDWQIENGVSGIISPGIRIQGFGTPWAHIALSLAQESYDYKQEQNIETPLYTTIAISQESFQNFDLVNEFLDELTSLQAEGFYLLFFQTGSQYRRTVDSAILPNILYFIHSLGEVNKFRVMVGYSDLNGYLYRTVGAYYFASGWSHNLRRLSEERWTREGGGGRHIKRYTSLQLMNTILVNPELRRIYEEGQISRVISDSQFDNVFSGTTSPQSVTWSKFLYHMQYLFVCSELDRLVATEDLPSRCRNARSTIIRALQLYTNLISDHNIEFSPESGPSHLNVWQLGLQEFCNLVNLRL